MSDINTDPNASGGGAAGSGGANGGAGGTGGSQVSYDTYQKVLTQKKNADAKLAEQDARLKEFEQQKLETEGKKDEVIANLKKDLEARNKKINSIAFHVLETKVHAKAVEFGAQNPKTVLKLMDLKAVQVIGDDDKFEVEETSITAQLETLKKEQPFLFKTAGPTIKDGLPANGQNFSSGGKDKTYAEMTLQEIQAEATKLSTRKP